MILQGIFYNTGAPPVAPLMCTLYIDKQQNKNGLPKIAEHPLCCNGLKQTTVELPPIKSIWNDIRKAYRKCEGDNDLFYVHIDNFADTAR